MSSLVLSAVALIMAALYLHIDSTQAQSVTYASRTVDVSNFDPRLGGEAIGQAGYWMANFAAPRPCYNQPTNESQRSALPSWAGPVYHVPPLINFFWRTFSLDGPCLSAGGFPTWANMTLPNGEHGISGAIVDPKAAGNDNNSINRISLNIGVPSSFYFHIVVDNTAGQYSAINKIRARGEHAGQDISPDKYPQPGMKAFNGVPDVYTFRFDNFTAGDFIKVQFNGQPASSPYPGASFAGFMFDTSS